MSYEQGRYRALLFLHNRITNIPYDQYFYRYSIAPGAFPPVAALTFSKAPAAGLNA
jgi:hypothetical protein